MLEELPHQGVGITVLGSNLHPLLSPYTDANDELRQLVPRLRQVVRRAAPGWVGPRFDDADPLQASQSLAEYARRNAVQALEDLAEVMVFRLELASGCERRSRSSSGCSNKGSFEIGTISGISYCR